MPIDYRVDEETGIAMAVGRGVVTAEDIIKLIERYQADTRLCRPHKELFDVRGVGEWQVSAENVRVVAAHVESMGDRFRGGQVAYVASSDLAFGIGRIFGVVAEELGIEIRVHRELAEACQWLGLSPERAEHHPGLSPPDNPRHR